MATKKKKSDDPSPLAKRICACGCEHEFQPNRSDQIYLDSRHANRAYNQGVRKQRHKTENAVHKIIRKNERIAEKYVLALGKELVMVNFTILKTEGFQLQFFTREIQETRNNAVIKLRALYNYCFRILKQQDITYIEIQKL
jgi:G:T/U-mismatch repair DNA glycosylase